MSGDHGASTLGLPGRAGMYEGATYPPIGDYALISDSNSVALVSREGSIDWCCIQRVDAGSCFGRLLDWEKGGYCSISPRGSWLASRHYIEGTLVLETTVEAEGGEVRIFDLFAMAADPQEYPYRQLLRIVEGIRGHVELELKIVPRFDYGEVKPWLRQEEVRLYSATGGNEGLLIASDAAIAMTEGHMLEATVHVHAGERVRLSIVSLPPVSVDEETHERPDAETTDRRLEETIEWWRDWSSRLDYEGPDKPGVQHSATVLKGLMHDLTGATAGAPTTSLPQSIGESLNYDYRYNWIRDSFLTVHSLAEIGFTAEANRFRRFIERSAAGDVDEMKPVYGVGGERRLTQVSLNHLKGYRGSSPVNIGNAAADQLQLGMYGELMNLAWYWHQRGNSPGDDQWRFLMALAEKAARVWREPDSGFWELGEAQHFVFSKVMCWAALDKGIRLAEECMRRAPVGRWDSAREEIREAVESEGYDEERGIFVQSFGNEALDATLLLLPKVEFVTYGDERMVRTTDAVREGLGEGGLIKRFADPQEGSFVACAFWLVECLAGQNRIKEAGQVFDRAMDASNDLGLFSEMYDTRENEMLGNFPQGLTHLSHISAAATLAEYQGTAVP